MNNKYKILLIEDEQNIRKFVKALLEANGYMVIEAQNASGGMMMLSSHIPDLIILDLGLPDRDGIELLRDIRKDWSVPVMVLSARSDEKDKVEALDTGANDYVTKPFGAAELSARIRSILRNTRQSSKNNSADMEKFVTGGLTIIYDARKVILDGVEVKLTQTEFNIVKFLSEHFGKVLTYSAIIKEIWGMSDYGSVKKLQVNMANIRKKLNLKPGDNKYISNELGVGYRMHNDTE